MKIPFNAPEDLARMRCNKSACAFNATISIIAYTRNAAHARILTSIVTAREKNIASLFLDVSPDPQQRYKGRIPIADTM